MVARPHDNARSPSGEIGMDRLLVAPSIPLVVPALREPDAGQFDDTEAWH